MPAWCRRTTSGRASRGRLQRAGTASRDSPWSGLRRLRSAAAKRPIRVHVRPVGASDLRSPGDLTAAPPASPGSPTSSCASRPPAGTGAQLYVSVRGEPLLDAAVGESVPGRPLQPDDLMLLYSAGKPATVAAVLQLWQDGRLGLDDPVADYVDGWRSGKERARSATCSSTPAGSRTRDEDLRPRPHLRRGDRVHRGGRAEWEPGTAAAYHPSSSWKVLGAIVEAVDGRPIDRYLREQIFDPIGMPDARLGIPVDEQPRFGVASARCTGAGTRARPNGTTARSAMVPYRIDEIHNQPWHIAKVEPGAGRARRRELGWFYESLLGYRDPVLESRTVELMGRSPAQHRGPVVPAEPALGSRRAGVVHGRHRPAGVRARRHGVVARALRPRARARDGGGDEHSSPTSSRRSSASSR